MEVGSIIRKNRLSLLILIVLTAIAVWYFLHNSKSTFSNNNNIITISDSASIAGIEIKNKEYTVVLNKQSEGWKLDTRYVPDHQMIDLCIRILTQVEIDAVVPEKASKQVADVLISRGTEIIVSDINNSIFKHLYIFGDGNNRLVYIMLADSKKPYIVSLSGYSGNFAGLFKAQAKWWRNKTILSFGSKQIAEIEVENFNKPEQSFKIKSVENGKPNLSKLNSDNLLSYNIDAMKTYFMCFKRIKAESFVENELEVSDSLRKETPDFKIKIFNNLERLTELLLFKKVSNKKADTDVCYVLVNNESVALVKYIETDLITRDLTYFMAKN